MTRTPKNKPCRDRRRSGTATPYLIVVLVVLFVAFAVAVDYSALWQTRVEMQDAADAAALGGAQTLVDDRVLLQNPAAMAELIAEARHQAIRFAGLNNVLNQPLTLDPNLDNSASGDIVFGALDTPRSPTFVLIEDIGDPSNAALTQVNALRIVARRIRARGNAARSPVAGFALLPSADIVATATAMLDRDTYGFRPLGAQPLPLVPLALLSDPTASNPKSWENRIVAHQGSDAYQFDRTAGAFVPGSDGLPEITVELAVAGGPDSMANGCLLHVGTTDLAGVSSQVRDGIGAEQLQGLGGQFALGAGNLLTVPGTVEGPGFGSAEASDLRDSLDLLRQSAVPRVWPLYRSVDASAGTAVLAGFVAARVVRVEPDALGQPLKFTLQPALLAVPSSLTDPARRGVGGTLIPNPYVIKVRLVG
jgi:hypothetical protein